MSTTTYYYPSGDGAAMIVPGGPYDMSNPGAPNYAGTNPFTAQYQGPGYTELTVNSATPGQYEVTFEYGTSNSFTETVYQTQYSTPDYSETTDGYYNYILSNTGVTVGQTYNLNDTGSTTTTQFIPNPAFEAAPLCFVSGTLIWTARGNVAVEDLAVGDVAVTASGGSRPIRWIGRREVRCATHHAPSALWPVRIRAGAFGADLPERDLFLSPGHPVVVGGDDGNGGHLVPIMCLINGTTIERVPVESVTYWHVELDTHDILLAEGLPAESYIDLGSRPWFDGAGALHDPDMALPGLPGRCRPVVVEGPVVEAERRRLDAVFAVSLSGPCAWPTFGALAVAF